MIISRTGREENSNEKRRGTNKGTALGADYSTDRKVLTLYEIASQLRDAWIITVITESPFSGKIYQYGNYGDGEWWEIGSTGGYA